MKGRYQPCQRVALNSVRAFSFLSPNFFCLISRTGKREVSVVQTRYSEQCNAHLLFSIKNLFLIS